MSAYLVSTATIDAVVRGGLQYGLVRRASADLVGQALLWANHRSLWARYGDTMPTSVDYHLYAEVPQLRAPVIYGCTACFEYQACEFEGWDASPAHHYTSTLLARIERRYPLLKARWEAGPRGEEFPWGIDDPADWSAWAITERSTS